VEPDIASAARILSAVTLAVNPCFSRSRLTAPCSMN